MRRKKLLVFVCLITLLLAGCSTKEKKDEDSRKSTISDKTETLNYQDEQIVFIKQYSNWAWGYQYSVIYVTANGNEYAFSYDAYDYNVEPYKLEDVLNFPRDEVKKTISSEDMEELIGDFERVGSIQFTEEAYACDYGDYSVYGVKYDDQGHAQFVKLGGFGDTHNIPDDEYAKKICNYFGLDWGK